MAYQDVNGIDLHYKIEGEGDPLLLIHGLGSILLDWECQTPYFSKNYKVITVDLRGHGRSGKPPGRYSIKLFADDAAVLLKEMWAKNEKKPYLNSLRALKNWDIRSDLNKIKAPTLIIHSENDYTPLEVKEGYAAKIENAEIKIVLDACHVVNVEKPAIYNKIVSDFMGSL